MKVFINHPTPIRWGADEDGKHLAHVDAEKRKIRINLRDWRRCLR